MRQAVASKKRLFIFPPYLHLPPAVRAIGVYKRGKGTVLSRPIRTAQSTVSGKNFQAVQ